MEKKCPSNSYIEKIAEILREEGDIETAKALKNQAEFHQSREMTEEEADRYEINKCNVRKAILYGDYERAVEFQSVALGLALRAFGAEHMETLKDMCELGECHFRNGAFKNAKDIYYRTMRISSTKFGALHPFSIRVQKNIHKCTEAVIRSDGLSNLEKHINSFFRMSSPSEPIEQIVRIDRLESLGEKLITRGKFGRAISIFKSLISLTLATALQDDEKAIQNISKYAGYLAGYGDLGEAEKTYRCVVQVRNRQNQTGDKNTELESAISDWAECLSQMGRTQSARETQELAEKISNS